MRDLCVVLVVLGLPLTANAQHTRSDPRPPYGPGSIGLPLPSIGLSASPYSPPWKWDRVQAPSWERPQTPAWERQSAPPWERGHVARPVEPVHIKRWRQPSVVYVMQPYPYLVAPPAQVLVTQPAATYPTPAPPSATGRVRLEVEPAALLQIYVDGVYIGTPADLGGELDLRPGSRRIEIRAPGYETLIFDARVEAARAITYRGELTPIAATAPAPPPVVIPPENRILYVIAGCYFGNVPPEAGRLPVGCDLSQLKTHLPNN